MSTEHSHGGMHITSDDGVGFASGSDSGYQRVRARLTQRTGIVHARAIERLEAARSQHEIDDRALLQTQHEVERQTQRGLALSSSEFWESVAAPLADRLAGSAKVVIDDAMEEFAQAAVRFRRNVALVGPDEPATFVRAEQDLCDSLDQMATIMLDPAPLDAVGERFQRRLRRTASRRLLPRSFLISPARTDRIVDRRELELLEQAPYAHCDKLLVAFELAHADVRAYSRDHVRAMQLLSSRRVLSQI